MVVFWCKYGVNRRDRFRKTLTYQAFQPSGSYPAVADEQNFYHLSCSLHKASSLIIRAFRLLFFALDFPQLKYRGSGYGKSIDITASLYHAAAPFSPQSLMPGRYTPVQVKRARRECAGPALYEAVVLFLTRRTPRGRNQAATPSQKSISTLATCARVALPCGWIVSALTPFMRLSPTAQAMASCA